MPPLLSGNRTMVAGDEAFGFFCRVMNGSDVPQRLRSPARR